MGSKSDSVVPKIPLHHDTDQLDEPYTRCISPNLHQLTTISSNRLSNRNQINMLTSTFNTLCNVSGIRVLDLHEFIESCMP